MKFPDVASELVYYKTRCEGLTRALGSEMRARVAAERELATALNQSLRTTQDDLRGLGAHSARVIEKDERP